MNVTPNISMSVAYEAHVTVSSGTSECQILSNSIEKYDDTMVVGAAASSSSASWVENVEKRTNITGAYDVLRCDLFYEWKTERIMCCKVWGLDFHLSRLKRSFHCLIHHHNPSNDGGDDGTPSMTHVDTTMITNSQINLEVLANQAQLRTKDIVDELLTNLCNSCEDYTAFEEALKERTIDTSHQSSSKRFIALARLTLLWTPSPSLIAACSLSSNSIQDDASRSIDVRGHIHTDGKVLDTTIIPNHIDTSLAIPPSHPPENINSYLVHMISNRKVTSSAKLSSWLNDRKLLDQFRLPTEASEILLVDITSKRKTQSDDFVNEQKNLQKYHILEGTSSNFFAVYHDNTLRTAEEGVVHGYIRQLALKFASKCGLRVELKPCSVEDGMKGLWKEAFITSSLRLIYPVRKVFVLDNCVELDNQLSGGKMQNQKHAWKEIWRCNVDRQELDGGEQMKWKWELLLEEILRYGGYD